MAFAVVAVGCSGLIRDVDRPGTDEGADQMAAPPLLAEGQPPEQMIDPASGCIHRCV
jgi:hypothetical protein